LFGVGVLRWVLSRGGAREVTREEAAAQHAWLRKEVLKGKLRLGFWVDLAQKYNTSTLGGA
jgi:hypothetical protein